MFYFLRQYAPFWMCSDTYEFAQPSQKTAELNDSTNTFEYPHVRKSDFLKQVSVDLNPEKKRPYFDVL